MRQYFSYTDASSNCKCFDENSKFTCIKCLSCECDNCKSGLFDMNGKRIIPKYHDMLKYQLETLRHSNHGSTIFPYSMVITNLNHITNIINIEWWQDDINTKCLICFKEVKVNYISRQDFLRKTQTNWIISIARCNKCANMDSHICENSLLPIIKYTKISKKGYKLDILPHNPCYEYCVMQKIILMKLVDHDITIINDIIYQILIYLELLH